MSGFTRRSFLASSAGAAAGAAVLATPGSAGAGQSAAAADASPVDTGHVDGAVIYVRDAATGGVLIMHGEQEVEVTDPALVAALARATNTKG